MITAVAKSYTHGTVNTLMVSADYIAKSDKVLIVDDFLATGEAAYALKAIVEKSGAKRMTSYNDRAIPEIFG